MRKSPIRRPDRHATPPSSTDSRYCRAGKAGVGLNSSTGVWAGDHNHRRDHAVLCYQTRKELADVRLSPLAPLSTKPKPSLSFFCRSTVFSFMMQSLSERKETGVFKLTKRLVCFNSNLDSHNHWLRFLTQQLVCPYLTQFWVEETFLECIFKI